MHIGREVEKFLRRSGMAPTRFGRMAVGDPRLVGDLRHGREPSDKTSQRILTFIREQESQP